MHSNGRDPRLFTPGFIFACLSTFTFFVSFSPLLATLPIYALSLGAGEAEIGLILGSFAITAVAFRPFVGREVDRRGTKGFMLVGALIFLVAALLYNFATSVPLLLLLRVFHGIGMATFTTASSAYVANIAPVTRRGEAMSYYGVANNVSLAISPATGIFLMSSFGFSALFFALAAAALVTILFIVPIRDVRPVQAHPLRWISRESLFPSAILFCLTVTTGCVLSFVTIFALERDIDAAGVGWYFTVYAIALIVARVFSGVVADRLGRAAAIIPGLIAVAVALVLLSFTQTLPVLLVVAVIYGLGFASVHPALMALAIDRCGNNGRGAAMATFTAAMDLGIGVGSLFGGASVAALGFTQTWQLAAAVALVGLIAFAAGWRAKL